MNAELKAKWVAALRSGKYAQGYRRLKFNNQFCCLGVLLDVSGFEWPDRIEDNAGIHPEPVAKLGLPWQQSRDLTDMNDGDSGKLDETKKPASFAEIADYIEANL